MKHESHTSENGKEFGLKVMQALNDACGKWKAEENIDYSKLAIKWGLYRDGVPDQEKAKELLEKEQKQNPNEEKEELIENITEEMEEEYRGNRGRI